MATFLLEAPCKVKNYDYHDIDLKKAQLRDFLVFKNFINPRSLCDPDASELRSVSQGADIRFSEQGKVTGKSVIKAV